MRKIAPAFIVSAIVALSSGSALALGDKNKDKKSPNAANTAATQQAGTLSGTATTSAVAPNASTHGTVGAQASTGIASSTNSASVSPAMPSGADATVVASADKPMVKDKAKHPNRDKCINLKPTDPKWAQNDCGAGDGAAAGSPSPSASGSSGASGSAAGASGSGGSSK